MKISDIIKIMDEHYPPELAEDWDNCGLLFGRPDDEVKRAFFTLNVTGDVILEAAQAGADMIISHHPILLNPMRQVRTDTSSGYMISILGKFGISLFAAHTNADSAPGGLNDRFADLLGLEESRILEPGKLPGSGIGRVGRVRTRYGEYIEKIKKVFGTKNVITVGIDEEDMYKRPGKIAAVNGGGGSYVGLAARAGAKLFITGEMNYHADLEAVDSGMRVIKLGHGISEMAVVDMFADHFKGTGLDILRYTEDIVSRGF